MAGGAIRLRETARTAGAPEPAKGHGALESPEKLVGAKKLLQSTPNSNATRTWALRFGNRRPFVDSRRRLFEITTRVCDGHHEARHKLKSVFVMTTGPFKKIATP